MRCFCVVPVVRKTVRATIWRYLYMQHIAMQFWRKQPRTILTAIVEWTSAKHSRYFTIFNGTISVNGACPSLVICAVPTPVKTGDEELEDRGKPGWERLRMICARSTSAWQWQDGALRIDGHGVYSWMWLRFDELFPCDTLLGETKRERERERERFVLVGVTVKAPLVQASFVWITHTRTHTGTHINANAAQVLQQANHCNNLNYFCCIFYHMVKLPSWYTCV